MQEQEQRSIFKKEIYLSDEYQCFNHPKPTKIGTQEQSAVQCNSVQCNAVQCNSIQCSAIQCNAVQCSAVKCSAVQCNAMQYSAMQCSAVQCSAGHKKAVKSECRDIRAERSNP